MIIKYDIKKYPFKNVVSEILNVDDLSKIHEVHYDDNFKKENYLKGVGGALQDTYFHRVFYENKQSFIPMYKKFIKEVIAKLYDEEILYQSTPTFRVQAHNSVSVIGLDHDTNSKHIGLEGIHRDKDYNHSDREVNYYLPFIDTNKYNTIWVESEPDKGDYKPFLLNYGQVKKWDGANLMHGNLINTSGKSRVSVDFRIIKKSDFVSGKKTLTKKIPFEIGGYWEKV